MKDILIWAQIILAILLIISILLQQKSVGMGSALSGAASGGEHFAGQRGVDRLLTIATIVIAVAFFGTALAYLFV